MARRIIIAFAFIIFIIVIVIIAFRLGFCRREPRLLARARRVFLSLFCHKRRDGGAARGRAGFLNEDRGGLHRQP